MKEHILIVDDDSQVTSFLERFFTKNGYRATGVASSAAMFEALENAPADLVVLDGNPLTVDPMAIKDISVVATYKEGEKIYAGKLK